MILVLFSVSTIKSALDKTGLLIYNHYKIEARNESGFKLLTLMSVKEIYDGLINE